MTSTVNALTRDFVASEVYESLAAAVDGVAVVLLVVLLVEQELIRAYVGAEARWNVRPLAVAVVPLVLAFVVIVVSRALGWR